jgi:hypothetical protein
VLVAARDPSEADARHIGANLVELAHRQHAGGEDPAAAWYSAGNWAVPQRPRLPRRAAGVRSRRRGPAGLPDTDYWLQETAAALFETGDYAAAAAVYQQARAAATGPAPGLLARTADCLAHAGDTGRPCCCLSGTGGPNRTPRPLGSSCSRPAPAERCRWHGRDHVGEPAIQAEQGGNEGENVDGAGEPWPDWSGLVQRRDWASRMTWKGSIEPRLAGMWRRSWPF